MLSDAAVDAMPAAGGGTEPRFYLVSVTVTGACDQYYSRFMNRNL